MGRYRFPASVSRRMYWSNEVAGCTRCPECKGPLEREHHTYMMAARKGGRIEPFMAGNNAGYFCPHCPTVVLDHHEFAEVAAVWMGSPKGVKFLVLGLVDLDAVPAEKRKLPFDEDTNPVPVVKFTNFVPR